jgi:hypothetical protein
MPLPDASSEHPQSILGASHEQQCRLALSIRVVETPRFPNCPVALGEEWCALRRHVRQRRQESLRQILLTQLMWIGVASDPQSAPKVDPA